MKLPIAAAFDQGQAPTIALVNHSTVPFHDWRAGSSSSAFLAALQKFADLFAGFWQTPCKLAMAGTVPPAAWAIIFTDNADQAGALGYHDLTASGLPQSHVFVKTTLADGELPSVTAAHELAEMLADPAVNLLAMSPRGTICALETADACEREQFIIDGTAVSDFVTPAYFEAFRRQGSTRFDYLQKVDRPFRILHGGYLPVYKPGTGWTQIFGELDGPDCGCDLCRAAAKRMADRDQRGHRFGRRAAPVNRSPDWPRVRAEFLRDNPTCAACGTAEALEVHHVWPVHFPGGRQTELEKGNMITLCERPGWHCHRLLGHGGDWKARNPHAIAEAALALARVKNREYAK